MTDQGTEGSSGTISSRGVELAWDRSGAGPALIWGHGLTSSRVAEDEAGLVDWHAVRRSSDVVRYDARGHGESGFSDDASSYGWADLAVDQLDLADALGIDRFISGGASMGAGTALHAACRAPDRVRALVLLIPPTAWETRAEQVEMYETMAQIIEQRGVETLIRAGADRPPPDPFAEDDDWRTRTADRMRSLDPVRYAGILRGAAFAQLPSRDEVAAIDVPVLVLAWTGDPGHPVSTAEELDALLPDARLQLAATAAELATWSDRIATFLAELR